MCPRHGRNSKVLKIEANLTQIASPYVRKVPLSGCGANGRAAYRQKDSGSGDRTVLGPPYVTLDTALHRSLAVAEPQTLLNQAGTGGIAVGAPCAVASIPLTDGTEIWTDLAVLTAQATDMNECDGSHPSSAAVTQDPPEPDHGIRRTALCRAAWLAHAGD